MAATATATESVQDATDAQAAEDADDLLRWNALAERTLAGEPLSRSDALAILAADDVAVPALLAAAFRVRRRHFGRRVQLYYLRNAKSGLCPEDCGYCSQSAPSSAAIPKYRFQSKAELLAGARTAAEAGARTYCIVASGRGPSDREVDHVGEAVREIKAETGLHICACLGLLKDGQAERLAAAGVDRINHNLNTSESHHAEIVGTHTYEDRLATLKQARNAGLELCSGLIVGMKETADDLVDAAFELAALDVASLPINFLIPIEGTRLGDELAPEDADHGGNSRGGESCGRPLTPNFCLKTLAMFRLACPTTELRIAGGREVHLRTLQPQALYAANSIFLADYLTTPGQAVTDDHRMIADLGFEVETLPATGGH